MMSKALDSISKETTERMPVLFMGHGSPMNAVEDNAYTRALSHLGARLPRPNAILMISAHWMTRGGSWVTRMEQPRTIHDFYGFPEELYQVRYPAPGSPQTAALVQATVTESRIGADDREWGLDHGTWAVLKHMYPKADIPVVQLSLDITKPAEFHFEFGKKLSPLRERGVLIMASGNIVHNLRQMRWEPDASPHEWAVEFDEWVKAKLETRDFPSLVGAALKTTAGKLSVPTPDHYWPLHYILGAANADEELRFEYEEMQNASISMRCLSIGLTAGPKTL